jgi:hypothetical protein
MPFEIVGDITQIETIATGRHIRELPRPSQAAWSRAMAEAEGDRDGPTAKWTLRRAELHWYEAHGIGGKEIKRKRYVD